MSTHCNFAAIIPDTDGTRFHVAIVRGRMASGNSGAVQFDFISRDLGLEEAARVAVAAPSIDRLRFSEYAPEAKP